MTDQDRAIWADALCVALVKCDPTDAAQACAAFLAEAETGGPNMGDLLGMVISDARLWADCAPPHEVAAYGTAALESLRPFALGISTRKRLFAALWQSFDPCDRQAFLSRVDAEGKFLRRGDQ